MNRRSFFIAALVTAGMVTHEIAKTAKISNSYGLLKSFFKRKEIPLQTGDVHIVKAGSTLTLPKNPSEGALIQIYVDNNSLKQPSIIKFEHSRIAGDDESLILDSMANFKLKYNSKSDNWQLV